MEYDNNNKAAIWKAKDKQSPKHPDFTGKGMIDGVEYYISAWKRDPEGNPKAPSLKFNFKKVDEVRSVVQEQVKPALKDEDFDDDVPF